MLSKYSPPVGTLSSWICGTCSEFQTIAVVDSRLAPQLFPQCLVLSKQVGSSIYLPPSNKNSESSVNSTSRCGPMGPGLGTNKASHYDFTLI